ncbi:MAG: hypothetical protein Q7R92_05965 [bacterium]|nr:hypothetical protein [bacterium]
MSKISSDLTKKYFQNKYLMSTGSDEWQDIKADFEVESDAIGGALSREDHNNPLGLDKIAAFKINLEAFKARIDKYIPKNEIESKERRILRNKINIGLEIYKLIIDGLE